MFYVNIVCYVTLSHNVKRLFDVQPGASVDMDDVRRSQVCRKCGAGHPFLLFQQGQEQTYSLFCDGHVITIGTSFAEAFDFLFKFIFVFDLKYCCGLTNFFKFFEIKVYKLTAAGQKCSPSINEVARLLGV